MSDVIKINAKRFNHASKRDTIEIEFTREYDTYIVTLSKDDAIKLLQALKELFDES